MIFTIGLAMTVVGWAAQVYRTLVKKDRGLSSIFLLFYAVGCVLLSVGNFLGNDATSGVLNALDVILPGFILIMLITWRKAGQREP